MPFVKPFFSSPFPWRHLFLPVLVVGMLVTSGCYRRVCPAYGSAFILDDSLLQDMFSLFGSDSMPLPPPRVRKDKNGLIVRVSRRRKERRARIIVARKMYPTPPETAAEATNEEVPLLTDSLAVPAEDALDSLSQPVAESPEEESQPVADGAEESPLPDELDSLAVAETADEAPDETPPYRYGYDPSDNFNVEQVFYNKRYGHHFVGSDAESVADSVQQDSLEAEFADIPDAYVEGSYEEEDEEGLEDFVLDQQQEDDTDVPEKKSKRRRRRKPRKTGNLTPAEEEVPEEETPAPSPSPPPPVDDEAEAGDDETEEG